MLTIITTSALLRSLPPSRITMERHFHEILWRNRERWLSKPRLIEELWGDDPQGGPLYARRQLDVYVCKARHLGWPIVTRHGFGMRLSLPP